MALQEFAAVRIVSLTLPDESPEPTEILTVVQCSETKIALKSAYGRYVGVNTSGELVGRAEAIGPREMWEPVFEEVSGAV